MRRCIGLVLAIVLGSISFCFAEVNNPCDKVDMAWLRTHSPIPQGEIVSKNNMGSLCEIILQFGTEYVPVYAGDDFIIAGEMIKHRKQVTVAKIEALRADGFRKILPKLDSVVAISYKPQKKTNGKIYMITDPLCPYCNMATKNIVSLADKLGIEVKAVLYSVHGEKGEQKAVEAICKKMSLVQYGEEEWKTQPFLEDYRCKEGEVLIDETKEIIRETGITGVPVFITDTGQFVNGANMAAVEALLTEKN
jgi:thiol:disulfide interchange protein DsbC